MKKITLFAIIFVLAGCGGNTLTSDFQPKGEGSIPIGCAPGEVLGGGKVTIKDASGNLRLAKLTHGVIYTSQLPFGSTEVTLTPNNTGYSSQTVRFECGAEQRHQLFLNPLPLNAVINVESIECNLCDGQVLELGSETRLVIDAVGFSSVLYEPTLALGGGVAQLVDGAVLRTTKRGRGALTIIIGDVTRTISFRVK